jgi:hypothetical protein
MKRVFLCGIATAFVAACTTQQTQTAQTGIATFASDVAALAPLANVFARDNLAPVAASAPASASGVSK